MEGVQVSRPVPVGGIRCGGAGGALQNGIPTREAGPTAPGSVCGLAHWYASSLNTTSQRLILPTRGGRRILLDSVDSSRSIVYQDRVHTVDLGRA